MNVTPQSGRRGFSLWHIFLGAIVGVGAIVITAALVERRYALALIALVVLALGLPVAARARRLRTSLNVPSTEEFWNNALAAFDPSSYELDRLGPTARAAYATGLLARVRERLTRHPDDLPFLTQGLETGPTKYQISWLFREIRWMPEALFDPMIRAGVEDPIESRGFVEACVASFGHRRVNDTLLTIFENGTHRAKIGVAFSLYWAEASLVFAGRDNFARRNATPESRAAFDGLTDLRARKDRLFLREFVNNPTDDVRAAIISGLNLRASAYDRALQPLVQEAIRIAREHHDPYIRHRVEIQLRNAGEPLQATVILRPDSAV